MLMHELMISIIGVNIVKLCWQRRQQPDQGSRARFPEFTGFKSSDNQSAFSQGGVRRHVAGAHL